MSQPDSRSDLDGGSEPGSGRESIYWDSVPALSDICVSKSYNCINMLYTKIQNKTTTVVVFTVSHTYSPESHLHIQKLYIFHSLFFHNSLLFHPSSKTNMESLQTTPQTLLISQRIQEFIPKFTKLYKIIQL